MAQHSDATGALGHGNLEVGKSKPHHGSAGNDPGRCFFETTTIVDQLSHGNADGNQQVLGLDDTAAGNAYDPVSQWKVSHDSPGHTGSRGHVGHGYTDIRGKTAQGYFTVQGSLDEVFFTSLGIFCFK